MKNQKVFRILALVFAVAMMLTIASCDMLDKLLGKAPEHVHTEEVIPAVAPTCTSIGLTEGKKCTECGEILVAQEQVAALGHTEVVVPAKEATCTTIGLTEGKKCSACDAVIVEQKVIDAKGHTEEVLAAVAATCTTTGLTEGKKCTACEKITVAQQEVAALGHTWGEEVTEVEAPTCALEGKGTVVCTVCEATDEVAIPATGNHTWDNGVVTTLPSCAPGEKTYTCTVCNDERFEAVQATGEHLYGDVFAIYPATCKSEGLNGKTCSLCNVTVKAGKIAALGGEHVYADGKCTTCGACELHSYVDYLAATTAGDPILTDRNNDRFKFQWGICTDCGYVDPDHEHIIKGGECYYCAYVYTQVTHRSVVDNDGDGFGDIYYFASALPERFRAEGVYKIDALNDVKDAKWVTYDEVKSGPNSDYWNGKKSDTPMPYAHVYVDENDASAYIKYEIEVDKAGTYEVAIGFRIKDVKLRGSTFTINEGTPSEKSFVYSYQWATEQDYLNARNNQKLIGGYMMVEMDLHEGLNTIKITRSTQCPKSQHFRVFFFNLKEEKHVHAYAEETVYNEETKELSKVYTCECGDTQTQALGKVLTVDEAIQKVKDLNLANNSKYETERFYVAVEYNGDPVEMPLNTETGFGRVYNSDKTQKFVVSGDKYGTVNQGDKVILSGVLSLWNNEYRLFTVKLEKVLYTAPVVEETPAQ